MQGWSGRLLTYTVLVVNVMHLIHAQAFLVIQFLLLNRAQIGKVNGNAGL